MGASSVCNRHSVETLEDIDGNVRRLECAENAVLKIEVCFGCSSKNRKIYCRRRQDDDEAEYQPPKDTSNTKTGPQKA